MRNTTSCPCEACGNETLDSDSYCAECMHEGCGPEPQCIDEADRWKYEYPTIRTRAGVCPCPAGWVVREPDADTVAWQRYPGIGEGLGTDSEVLDVFEDDTEGYNDAREETAMLVMDPVEIDMRAGTETIEYELTVDGETVFRRVDPDHADAMVTVAEALSRFSNGRDYDNVSPESGRLPDEMQEQQVVEQRKQQNQSLGDFA